MTIREGYVTRAISARGATDASAAAVAAAGVRRACVVKTCMRVRVMLLARSKLQDCLSRQGNTSNRTLGIHALSLL